MAARVDTELWSPSLDLVHENTEYGAVFAYEEYGYYPDEPGWWTAVAYHYAETVVQEMYCNVLDEECMCAYGGSWCPGIPADVYLGQTEDDVVLTEQQVSEPTFPCTAEGITDRVIDTMRNWPVLRFERGGTVVCQNSNAIPLHLRDSFKEVFPGTYMETEDPCTLNLVTAGAIGGFHSHPLFNDASQMNRGVRCGGFFDPEVPAYIAEDIPVMNSTNYSFTNPGDYVWLSETGTPSYLLVPNTSQIKMLSPGGGFPTTVWSE
jgi:hypothetical protein